MPIFLSSRWAECLLALAGQRRAATLQPTGAAVGVWGSEGAPDSRWPCTQTQAIHTGLAASVLIKRR